MHITVHRNDVIASAIIGEAVAWLVIATNQNLGFEVPYFNLIVAVLFPAASAFGMFVAEWFSTKWAVLTQVAKFVLVGALNTFIDLGLFNLLIYVSDTAQGAPVIWFKAGAFIVAVINSYFWNKFWTFKAGDTHAQVAPDVPEHVHHGGEFFQFFLVSFIGLMINLAVAGFVINILGVQGALTAAQWANVGALLATAASLIWNFLGYKFIVFKR